MRQAAVAGRFYPRTKKEIENKIQSYIKEIQKNQMKENAQASISPHAGYRFSGDVATWSISSLKKANTYIIIGPSHQPTGTGVSLSKENWKTPLGELEVDKELVNELKGIGIVENKAHIGEHSIEVQLPILQYIHQDFKILPIMLSIQDKETVIKLADKITEISREKDIAIISSSDFTHYQPKRIAEKQDKEAIEKIKELDLEGFYQLIKKENLSICGYGPIGVSMNFAKNKDLKPELKKYKTSGDETGNTSQVVGYASVVFR